MSGSTTVKNVRAKSASSYAVTLGWNPRPDYFLKVVQKKCKVAGKKNKKLKIVDGGGVQRTCKQKKEVSKSY